MDKEPIKSQYFEELNTVRMFILLESEPQSNKYVTLLLNKDQYMKISECIVKTLLTAEDAGFYHDDYLVELPDVEDIVEIEEPTEVGE